MNYCNSRMDQSVDNKSMIDIVIIGAGISGLACARELTGYDLKLNFIVLEASNNVGGRIRTKTAGDGTKLELGAHFIHGTKNNILYDFALKKQLFDKSSKKHYMTKIKNCFPMDMINTYSTDEINKGISLGNRYVKEIINEMREMSANNLPLDTTIGDHMLKKFETALERHKHDRNLTNIIKSIFLKYANKEKIESCCASLYDVSFRGFLNHVDLEGDSAFVVSEHCSGGFKDIVDSIVNDIKPNTIRLESEVIGIDNVVVDGVSKIKVACQHGVVYYADSVVLTVSVGVLKHFLNSDVFRLEIPDCKRRSFNKFDSDRMIKIFFKFKKPIDKEINFFDFYPSPHDRDTSNFIRNNNIIEFNRVGDSDWWLFWNEVSKDSTLDDPAEHLKETFFTLHQLYPCFPIDEIDEETIVVSDCSKDKFLRYCYSYIKVGADESAIVELAEPLSYGESNLLFAGEATCPFFYATTHGAFLSGIREANRIKSLYCLN